MNAPQHNLELRQQQKLVMTTKLQEAIRLLQLPQAELRTYVETHLAENPLLDTEEYTVDKTASDADLPKPNDDIQAEDKEYFDKMLFSANNTSSAKKEGDRNDWAAFYENTLEDKPSLRHHLYQQLHIEVTDAKVQHIASYLIDNLDPSGYWTEPMADVAERLGCSRLKIEDTLKTLQTFDPIGLFARTLQECLTLQLAERHALDAPMLALLDNLELVGTHAWDKLLKKCAISRAELKLKLAELKSVDPKPGQKFTHEIVQNLIPDIYVRPQETGYFVEINTENLPRVLLNKEYYQEVLSGVKEREEKEYIKSCYQEGNWLLKALDQRAGVMLQVGATIVRLQKDFFEKGVAHMRPLTLQEIAVELDVHESTVSRIVNNKYMATPRGTFELKYFFSSKVANLKEDQQDLASTSVRSMIADFVKSEPLRRPYSDEKLCALLQEKGIVIARRTVAKYREMLKIGNTSIRRKQGDQL